MVREMAVRLQKLAALHPSAQFFQHVRIKTARAVTGIHHHVKPQKRLLYLRIDAFNDQILQVLLIGEKKWCMQNLSRLAARFHGDRFWAISSTLSNS